MADVRYDVCCLAKQMEEIAADDHRRARERMRQVLRITDVDPVDYARADTLRREACEYLRDSEDLFRLAQRLRVRRASAPSANEL